MVHGVRLREGRAELVPQPLRAAAPARARPAGSPTSPARTGTAATGGPNTNVGGFAGTTWAMVEAGGCPVELTYELETVGRNDFFGTLPGGVHRPPEGRPDDRRDARDGLRLPQWLDHVQYVVVATGRQGRAAPSTSRSAQSTMLHDMSLTERYASSTTSPCRLDIEMAMNGSTFPLRWQPGTGCRVGLLPREGEADDVIWVDLPECYSFHPMNAYDDADGNVVIDLVRLRLGCSTRPHRPVRGQPRPRWSAGRSTRPTRHASIDVIDATPQEFPRVRGSLTARPYRYGYAAAVDQEHGRVADVQARPADRGARGRSTTARAAPPASRCSSAATAARPRTTAG